MQPESKDQITAVDISSKIIVPGSPNISTIDWNVKWEDKQLNKSTWLKI